ncbi:hypothetical protein QJS10_CPB15g01911 [Acorus calamus]|uniref:DJ-1/PfpI domain-containing protein n=1 Tax=Acorus calamus TaxID=4465 RepID=A0AAV9D6D1_ACOCL|nr:hypothetical protein QJS10_CPB15g01911 [Acorus calamus]
MGSEAGRSVLMICGEYMEDYEAIVPFHALQSYGVRVHCVAPRKFPGDTLITAVHEFTTYELYTETEGHHFTLNADFSATRSDAYDALVIPGGRFTEPLASDPRALALASEFARAAKPVVVTCHSQVVLAAAGVLKGGTRCTAFPSLKRVVGLAGGVWVEPSPFSLCVSDRRVISAIGWPAHANVMRELVGSIGGRVVGGPDKKAVLFLVGDYVEDYEANVPFQAIGGLGCTADAACPSKGKGGRCITAVHDIDVGGDPRKVCAERHGHYFSVTKDWGDVRVEDYDALVVPGGRSPELLVGHDEVVRLAREFSENGKVVAGIGQGLLVLAAAGLLEGKKCASSIAMKPIVKLAGGEVVEPAESFTDAKLLTATGWPVLPQFLADLFDLLGLRVAF